VKQLAALAIPVSADMPVQLDGEFDVVRLLNYSALQQ
jgi:hypothetical protein